jgi:hypothetical protein
MFILSSLGVGPREAGPGYDRKVSSSDDQPGQVIGYSPLLHGFFRNLK